DARLYSARHGAREEYPFWPRGPRRPRRALAAQRARVLARSHLLVAARDGVAVQERWRSERTAPSRPSRRARAQLAPRAGRGVAARGLAGTVRASCDRR